MKKQKFKLQRTKPDDNSFISVPFPPFTKGIPYHASWLESITSCLLKRKKKEEKTL